MLAFRLWFSCFAGTYYHKAVRASWKRCLNTPLNMRPRWPVRRPLLYFPSPLENGKSRGEAERVEESGIRMGGDETRKLGSNKRAASNITLTLFFHEMFFTTGVEKM